MLIVINVIIKWINIKPIHFLLSIFWYVVLIVLSVILLHLPDNIATYLKDTLRYQYSMYCPSKLFSFPHLCCDDVTHSYGLWSIQQNVRGLQSQCTWFPRIYTAQLCCYGCYCEFISILLRRLHLLNHSFYIFFITIADAFATLIFWGARIAHCYSYGFHLYSDVSFIEPSRLLFCEHHGIANNF